MRSTVFIAIALIVASGAAFSDEQSFRTALVTLPPKYLGDIPLVNRENFLRVVQSNGSLDAANGWLHWSSDAIEEDTDMGATSMVWAKELPRPGKKPLVFVHMAKPFADGSKPAANNTFILEQIGKEWVDVTKTVMPPTVDMAMHFRTRKADTMVEVAPWKEIVRRDGRGTAYTYGDRVMDLRWTGKEFVIEKSPSKELTKN